MELYILSKEDLSIKSIIKPSDYEINLDEETNAKTTFIFKKCDGLKEGNFIVVNGLYKQFLFVIPSGGITTEKGSNIVTVTALDISNIFDRKIIKKDTDLMTNNSIEEFLAKTISENFVNSDDPYLNIPYMLINWKTETKAVVDTNAENGLYNFHTFLINCRQYKNICTDFKFKEKIKESYRTAQGKKIEIQNGKKGTHLLITTKGETSQVTRSGNNLFNYKDTKVVTSGITVDEEGWITATYDNTNGTTNKYLNYFTTKSDKLSLVKDYKAFVEIKNVSGTGALILASDDSISQSSTRITYTFGNLSSGDVKANLFTTKSDFTNCSYMLRSFISFSAGQSGSITFRISVLKDTKITPENFVYEQYGASPSPDYRSPIENVEGKNKFDKNNMVEAIWDNGKTNTVTLLEDGRIQSTANYAQWSAKCINIPNLKANTDYVVSGKIISSTANNAMIIVKGYKNNTLSNIIYHQYAVATRFELSFNSSDYEKIGISLSGSNNTLGTTYTTIFDEIQIEEGTVATDYVPYNSLEIKDIGKNLYNDNIDNYIKPVNYWLYPISLEQGATYKLSGNLKGTKMTGCTVAVVPFGNQYSDFKDILPTYTLLNTAGKLLNRTITVNNTFTSPKLAIYATSKAVAKSIFENYEIQLEKDNITTYKPYQEQKVTFPLSKGQKLYKASYLASDGIHHKRKQVVLDGTEEINYFAITQGSLFRFTNVITNPTNNIDYVPLSDHYIGLSERQTGTRANNNIYINHSQLLIDIIDNRFTSISDYKDWLSNNPITVEYELLEEEIIPYTEEQQEAWNKIEELMMFEGYNSIESNAQLDIKYNYIYPENAKLIIDIENKEDNIAIIDTTLAEVTDSNKIYEANYTAKVQVLIREDNSIYNLYLKTNRTTTENKDDPDRASGKVETISVDTADKAREEALNVMKGNTYRHLVEFKIPKTSKLIDITKLYIGRKVKIKTEDDIYDSYISAITLNDENFVYFKSGNLRIDLLDKLKKQKESVGNKLDVEGGTIKNLKIEKDLDINGNYYKNGEKIDIEMQIKTGEEYATNEYIDGKRVYIKQLEFNDTVSGGLDNRLVKSHGIVGAEKIWIDLSNSYIKATTTNATYPLPVILYSGNISALSVIVDLTNIYMEAQGGWGDIWTKVIRLKYTKEQEV